jgi:uncharacterized protein (UPF0332 family)
VKYSEEVKALLHKARRSLDAAKELFSKGYYDFAVSRAYYAMFYSAEAVLLTKDLKFKKHSAVISGFGKEFVKTGEFEEKYHGYTDICSMLFGKERKGIMMFSCSRVRKTQKKC